MKLLSVGEAGFVPCGTKLIPRDDVKKGFVYVDIMNMREYREEERKRMNIKNL